MGYFRVTKDKPHDNHNHLHCSWKRNYRNIGRDIFAGLKNIVGGEIEEYTKLQAQSSEQAMQRMVKDAERLGADAVINVRFGTSMVMQGAAEMLAYLSLIHI